MADQYPNQPQQLKDFFDAVVSLFVPPEGQDRDQFINGIRDRKIDIGKIYRNMLPFAGPRPDYSDQWMRWTYMYTYLSRHVHLVYSALLNSHRAKSKVMDTLPQAPIVCSVGGGPNTDALGLCLFLSVIGRHSPLTPEVHVLDRYPEWQLTWEGFREKLRDDYQQWMPQTTWREFDMLTPIDQEVRAIFESADIITFIKSLSSVVGLAQDDRLKRNVSEIIGAMKRGSLLLFIDNQWSQAKSLLDAALHGQPCRIVFQATRTDALHRSGLYSPMAEYLNMEIDHDPVLKAGRNVMMLVQKQ